MVQCPSCEAQFPKCRHARNPRVRTVTPSPDPRALPPSVPAPAARKPQKSSAAVDRRGSRAGSGGPGRRARGPGPGIRQAWGPNVRRPIPFPQEDDGERVQEVRRAFNQKPLAENEIAPELKPLFEDLGGASGRPTRIASRVPRRRRHGRLVRRHPRLAPAPPGALRVSSSGLHQGIGQSLAAKAKFLEWTSFEIRSVKKLNDDEAVAILRHQQDDGTTLNCAGGSPAGAGPGRSSTYGRPRPRDADVRHGGDPRPAGHRATWPRPPGR